MEFTPKILVLDRDWRAARNSRMGDTPKCEDGHKTEEPSLAPSAKRARRPSLNMERCLHYYLFINAREVLHKLELKPTNDCTQRQPRPPKLTNNCNCTG